MLVLLLSSLKLSRWLVAWFVKRHLKKYGWFSDVVYTIYGCLFLFWHVIFTVNNKAVQRGRSYGIIWKKWSLMLLGSSHERSCKECQQIWILWEMRLRVANPYLVPSLRLTLSHSSFPNNRLRCNGALKIGDSSMLSGCDVDVSWSFSYPRWTGKSIICVQATQTRTKVCINSKAGGQHLSLACAYLTRISYAAILEMQFLALLTEAKFMHIRHPLIFAILLLKYKYFFWWGTER